MENMKLLLRNGIFSLRLRCSPPVSFSPAPQVSLRGNINEPPRTLNPAQDPTVVQQLCRKIRKKKITDKRFHSKTFRWQDEDASDFLLFFVVKSYYLLLETHLITYKYQLHFISFALKIKILPFVWNNPSENIKSVVQNTKHYHLSPSALPFLV